MFTTTTPDPDDRPLDIDEDGEYIGYPDDHEMGVQGRADDYQVQPDAYLDAAYEDRFDIGEAYEF